MSDVLPLQREERNEIATLLDICQEEVPSLCFTSRKAYIHNIGYNGSVFTKGNAAIVDVHGIETPFRISQFLSVRCQEDFSTLLAVGENFQACISEDGDIQKDFWSGFVKVHAEPLAKKMFVPAHKIRRKTILFGYDDNSLCVADYQRSTKELSYSIVVPAYIDKGDMALIQGEQLKDIWHGHVQNVNHVAKTIDIFFYVESKRTKNVFTRETTGRHGRNTVGWDSVVGIARGSWLNQSCWQKDHC